MELRHYFSLIRKWLWLIALGGFLAAGSAYLFSILMTPVYQSTATLLISQGSNSSGTTYTDILTSQNIAATYVEQLKSPVLADQVINELSLPFTTKQLAQSTTVQQIRNTMLINISIEDISPERAMATANQFAKGFIASNAAIQQSRYQAAQSDLDRQIADLRKQIDGTQKALAPLGNPLDPKNVTAPEYVRTEQMRLQLQLDTLQTQYTVLLKSAQDYRLAASRSVDSITISTPAQLPQMPVRPNKMLNTLLGAVVGLLLGVGTAFLIEYLDDTFKSPEDVTHALDLATVGAVAQLSGIKSPRDTLVVAESPRAPYAEAYRNLRTNLQFSLLRGSSTALVVTSAEPGEGKSTTVANLGAVWAQMGRSVILVDTDLRRPSLHRVFSLPPEPGLTDLLLDGMQNTDAVLRETGVQGMRILASGKLPPNPAELLASDWMERLIESLKQKAEIVIFDAPPILPVTDAILLAAKTGYLLWVIYSGRTRTDVARRAKAALAQANAKILGVVLNRVATGRGYGYYYYYDYYSKDGSKKKHQRVQGEITAIPEQRTFVSGNGNDQELDPVTSPETLR